MNDKQEFILTEEHIKLLSKMSFRPHCDTSLKEQDEEKLLNLQKELEATLQFRR